MASRHAIIQGMLSLGTCGSSVPALGLAAQAARLIGTSALQLWPDVVVPSMGESIKEGSIAAVLKQVGQPVREDEVIAQVETDKVTIDVRAPSAGFLHQLLVKPTDTVVAGQLVAVVGSTAPATGPTAPASAAAAAPAAASGAAAHATAPASSGRAPMIHFPPRFTASGSRISDLPEAEYTSALAAAEAAVRVQQAAPAPAPAAATAPSPPVAPAAPAPAPAAQAMPVTKAAPPPISKNRLQYITRPDGRGGPPRRPLTERELEMINLGGVY